MSQPLFRDAEHADLPAIVAIYNAAIPGRLATADLTPVSVESRKAWFTAHGAQTYPIIVAALDCKIIGWGALSTFYGRPAYRRTAEVAVYIDPAYARQGIGQNLTLELLNRAKQLGFKSLLAFIFAHNEPSVRLFARNGFTLWGHLPRIADMDNRERDLDIYGLTIK